MTTLEQQVDDLFSAWDKPDSPGCALAVIRDGEIIYQRGYGLANLEYDIPITPKTIFHIASISKQFTAMAVALLAQEGKLTFDDDIRRYLPELPDFGSTITPRHLLNHTSGLRDQWELLILAGWRMDDVITTADVLDLMQHQQELNFEPGSNYLYCNAGYTLAALIVERVSGQTFPAFCEERIFQPLAMADTHFHDDHMRIVKNRAYSYYSQEESGFKHLVLSYATAGATSLFTTVEDLARWDRNFETGVVGGPAVLEQMLTRAVLNDDEVIPYGLGVALSPYRGLKLIQHSGGDAGFRSHWLRFPDQRFSVVILSNIGSAQPWQLATQIADIYLADTFTEAKAEGPKARRVELTPDQLAAVTGFYHNHATGETHHLHLEDGKLVSRNGSGLELIPVAADHFQMAAPPHVNFKIESDGQGSRRLLVWDQARPVAYEAIPAANPTADDLAAFVGDYYSPELDVRWRIDLHEGALVLPRRKYGQTELRPTFVDGFNGDLFPQYGHTGGLRLVFSRDDQGRIEGMRVTTGRVRHVQFVRSDGAGRLN